MSVAQDIVHIMLTKNNTPAWESEASAFISGLTDEELLTEVFRKSMGQFVRTGWINFAWKRTDPLFFLRDPDEGSH